MEENKSITVFTMRWANMFFAICCKKKKKKKKNIATSIAEAKYLSIAECIKKVLLIKKSNYMNYLEKKNRNYRYIQR